jgi:hypothetical protein
MIKTQVKVIQKFFVDVMGKHFRLTVLRILCILVQNALSSMSTEWRMATAYQTLMTKYPEYYSNRGTLDDKWIEIIQNNNIDNPSTKGKKRS